MALSSRPGRLRVPFRRSAALLCLAYFRYRPWRLPTRSDYASQNPSYDTPGSGPPSPRTVAVRMRIRRNGTGGLRHEGHPGLESLLIGPPDLFGNALLDGLDPVHVGQGKQRRQGADHHQTGHAPVAQVARRLGGRQDDDPAAPGPQLIDGIAGVGLLGVGYRPGHDLLVVDQDDALRGDIVAETQRLQLLQPDDHVGLARGHHGGPDLSSETDVGFHASTALRDPVDFRLLYVIPP